MQSQLAAKASAAGRVGRVATGGGSGVGPAHLKSTKNGKTGKQKKRTGGKTVAAVESVVRIACGGHRGHTRIAKHV